jgi:ABC-type bacteriocin/lantibiotic exporter with double-glycine peptidase domain
VAALILSFINSWQLSFVALGLLPIVVVMGVIRSKVVQAYMERSSEVYSASSILASDAIAGIRTVKSFAQEQMVMDKFK